MPTIRPTAFLGILASTGALACAGERPPKEGVVEDCTLTADRDGDGLRGCADPQCATEPSCLVAHDLYEASLLAWFRLPHTQTATVDPLNGGRLEVDVDQGGGLVVAVSCVPGTHDASIGTCGSEDNAGTFTRAWHVEPGELLTGEVILHEEAAFFSVDGSWGPGAVGAGPSEQLRKAYPTAVVRDIDGDGTVDVALTQPAAAAGDTLYMWFGAGTGLSGPTPAHVALPGGDHGRLRAIGDLDMDGIADLILSQGVAGSGAFARIPGGNHYNAETLAAAIEHHRTTVTHPEAEVRAWSFPSATGQFVGAGAADLPVLFTCQGSPKAGSSFCGGPHALLGAGVLPADTSAAWRADFSAMEPSLTVRGTHGLGGPHAPTRGALVVADLDGDGHDDLLIGAPGLDTTGLVAAGEVPIGAIVAVRGIAGGWTGPLDLERDAVLIRSPSHDQGRQFGLAVAAADFDGDGFDDILVWDDHSALAASIGGYEDVPLKATAIHLFAGNAGFFKEGQVTRPVAALVRIDRSFVPAEQVGIPNSIVPGVPPMPEVVGDLDGGGTPDVYVAAQGLGNYLGAPPTEGRGEISRDTWPFAWVIRGERLADLLVEGRQRQQTATNGGQP